MLNRSVRFPLLLILALAIVGFIACGDDYDSTGDGNDDSGSDYASAPDEAIVDSDESVASQPGGGGESSLPQTLDRKIIRTATISLEVEDVAGGVRQIEDVALAAGGFVSGSSITTGDDESEPQTASITIRVPAESYAAVMTALRGAAEAVRSESSDTSEVTEEYTDLQSRLRNLEATEAQYLVLLEQAQTIDEILTVQDRLNATRAEIEQVTGRINQLDNLTELATINISLFVPAVASIESSQGWAQRAWEASWEASKDFAVVLGSIAIVLAVVAVWVIPVAIIGALCWRLFGRRIANWLGNLSGSAPTPPSETSSPG